MYQSLVPLFACLAFAHAGGAAQGNVVLVTGATGRSGKEAYNELKALGFTVRALVRNATKAKAELGCQRCDESEGVFVGDILDPKSMAPAMKGVQSLVITVGPVFKCRFGPIGCKFLPGGTPKEIVFHGLKTQVAAFAGSAGPALGQRHVVLLSTGLTTKPDNFLDRIGNGSTCFYSLNGETALMNSGVPFTIVKACGLSDGASGRSHLVVGHDDSVVGFSQVSRADVARVLAAAVAHPTVSKGLRFDLCTSVFGKPTADIPSLFKEAAYSWDPRVDTAAVPLNI